MPSLGPFELGRVHAGEALALLRALPSDSVDAIITDPPYSSGGFTRGDRNQDPGEKYCFDGETLGRISFTGDNRDGRSWAYWTALWLSECHRVTKPGGYALVQAIGFLSHSRAARSMQEREVAGQLALFGGDA